jgi:hypothetical protein
MSLKGKFTQFVTGLTEGLPAGLRGGTRLREIRNKETAETDARTQLLRTRVFARFDRGDQVGAIKEAERLGLTTVVEELRAVRSAGGKEIGSAMTAAGQQAPVTSLGAPPTDSGTRIKTQDDLDKSAKEIAQQLSAARARFGLILRVRCGRASKRQLLDLAGKIHFLRVLKRALLQVFTLWRVL